MSTTAAAFGTAAMWLAVRAFSGWWGFARFSLDFGERRSNKLAIHFSIPPKRLIGFKAERVREFWDERDGVQRKIFSQATAIRGEKRNFTRNGKPCKRLIDMLHNRDRKSKGGKVKLSESFSEGRNGSDGAWLDPQQAGPALFLV